MKKLVKMIDISIINSTLVITSDYPYAFPFEDGQLTVPVNSITYSIDSSDYIAFRSAANNDVLFTGTLGLISINGTKVNREEFIDQFNAIAYAAGGSGSGGGSTISVDGALSTTSTNPVQNRTITNKLNEIIGDVNALAEDVEELAQNTGSTGGGAINVIEMTQEEYDKLGSYQEAFYIITDAQSEWIGTQAEYDALPEISDKITYYIIEG